MLSYILPFWEHQWALNHLNQTYGQFVDFLAMLAARCTTYFPLKKARLALPKELVMAIAKSRSLSFKAKRSSVATLKEGRRQITRTSKGGTQEIQTRSNDQSTRRKASASRGNKPILVSDEKTFQRLFISVERNHSSVGSADQRSTRNGEGNSPSLPTTVRGTSGIPPSPIRGFTAHLMGQWAGANPTRNVPRDPQSSRQKKKEKRKDRAMRMEYLPHY